jgi:peptide/nickel transport system ATP-binding protein
MADADVLLRVEDLSVVFDSSGGEVHATDRVSFDVLRGQTIGVVGESGSGKSVTALAIMGLLPRRLARIVSGNIWFDHPERGRIDLLQQSEKEMELIRGRHIAMIFQEPMSSLNPVQRCGWQVMESLLWHKRISRKQAREQVLGLFEEVRLPDPQLAFHAWPHELSGGQRQRVMIAMAMACKPALLIADEPTTALDVTVQKSILQLLSDLQQQHQMSVVFISHDLGVVGEVALQVAVMLNGKLVEQGTVGQVFARPVHPYTRALLRCRPGMQNRPVRLAVVGDFLGDEGQEMKTGEDILPEQMPEKREARHARMYAGEAVLKVKDLHASFVTGRNLFGKPIAHFEAVKQLSFDVYKGETLGLVGESGCGKTTLGRSIMRLTEPGGGTIHYKGQDMAAMTPAALRKFRTRMQIIFQDPYSSLTPGMSIGEAIMEPMRVHRILDNNKQRKQRAMELLERVRLEGRHFYRYPHEFSGGQRQRASIARALALNPEFVICDESVSALDVSVQAQVLNLLNDLKSDFDLTYIFISHDLAVVKYMSDRIMVMQEGRLVELAEADELYAAPSHPYTRKLIQAIPGYAG